MKTIKEYMLIDKVNDVPLPIGAQILSLNEINNRIVISVKINTNNKILNRKIYVIREREKLPNCVKYLGAVVLSHKHIYYVFEESRTMQKVKVKEILNK